MPAIPAELSMQVFIFKKIKKRFLTEVGRKDKISFNLLEISLTYLQSWIELLVSFKIQVALCSLLPL